MTTYGKDNIIKVFNPTALEHNIKRAINTTNTEIGIVVKSNSYGLGIENTLPIFEKYKIKNFFCQTISEAIKIRTTLKNPNAQIYTFAGVQSGEEELFIQYNICPICVSLNQIKTFNSFAKSLTQKPKIGIHFDTGMNRTGLSFQDTEILSQNFSTLTKNLDVVMYISHLHSSYDKHGNTNKQQLTRFKTILSKLPKRTTSLSATGGTFKQGSEYHFDILRIGYGIYGIMQGMEPVITVYAKILQIREVAKGETIGYFAGYKAPCNMKIAVLNIGYADGYSRSLSHTNKWKDKIRKFFKSGANFATSYMTIKNYKCPVVGIISMNNTIIDVSNVPQKILDNTEYVEVIGKNAKITDFREANGFVPCDLLTSLLQPTSK